MSQEQLEDKLEVAYWDFDARHKGYGRWKSQPMSERDAFKAVVRGLLADQAAEIERLWALLREAYNFWAHYSCINEPAQDDIADEKDAIIERMRTALAEQK